MKIEEKMIYPIFTGTTAITLSVLLLRLLGALALPVIDVSVALSTQLATFRGIGFLILCLASILFTCLYKNIYHKKVVLNNIVLKGGSYGFITSMFSLILLLIVSIITQSIVDEVKLKSLLLSVIAVHVFTGIAIAIFTTITDRHSESQACSFPYSRPPHSFAR